MPNRGRQGRGGSASRGGRGRGRGRYGLGSNTGASGPEAQAQAQARPRNPKRLVVTLHVRTHRPLQQLPTPPESTHLSVGHTPRSLAARDRDREAIEGGEGARQKDQGKDHCMAPVRDPNNVDDQIKDVIQHLFEVQSAVHGYLPETQGPLVDKITDLTHSLSALRTLAASPNSSVAGIELPPEILDYVDGGRNPDVYTREFVELVQRGNAVLNGKQEAFRSFSEVFAQELASAMPETKGEVERVMSDAGLKVRGTESEDGEGRGRLQSLNGREGEGVEEGARRGSGNGG